MNTNAIAAVVPGYYLVCYNDYNEEEPYSSAVVPGYYLVCYNIKRPPVTLWHAVVPGYYLVCYNPLCTIVKRIPL